MNEKNIAEQKESSNGDIERQYSYYSEDEVNIRELWNILWLEKPIVLSITILFAVCSLVYALIQTEIYRGESVVAPAMERGAANQFNGQLGSAAAFIGMDLVPDGSDRVLNTLALLKSRDFIGRFIEQYEILVPLFAGTWNSQLEESGLDPSVYDLNSKEWLTESGPPTKLEAYRRFSSALTISRDREANIIRITFDWHDPVLASRWLNLMISNANAEARAKDVEEATSAIAFLESQLDNTRLVEIQRVFYDLIESQTRIIMLADVREEYVFQVIDPAVVPDQKIAPQRATIAIIGTLIGFLLSIALVYLRSSFRDSGSATLKETS